MNTDKNETSFSFVVPTYAAIFRILGVITPFSMLRAAIPWLRKPVRAYAVVEVWVLANTILAFVASLLANIAPTSPILIFLLVYGALRVYEILVVQMNVLFFDEWRARSSGNKYSLRGYRRIALLLLHNFAEIVFWFVVILFFLQHSSHLMIDNPTFITTFRASLLSMVSFSSDNVRALDSVASVILAIQSMVGIFMTILMLSRFISLIPAPASQEKTESNKQ